MPGIKQALGLQKQPKKTAAAKAQTAARASTKAKVVNAKELDEQIRLLEGATAKLVKAHTKGHRESQDAAFQVKTAAERILGNLPHAAAMGPQHADAVKRLQRVVERNQVIWDEHLVLMSKRKAEALYMEAGRAAKGAGAAGAGVTTGRTPSPTGGFAHLTGGAKWGAFSEDLGPSPNQPGTSAQTMWDTANNARAAAKAAGLTPAEAAGIFTFTSQDYKYINPATANSSSWMVAANPAHDLFDKPDKTEDELEKLKAALVADRKAPHHRADERKAELASRGQEGGTHAALAVQGMTKLAARFGLYRGKAWRGEVWTKEQLAERYPQVRPGKFTTRQRSETVHSIRSQTSSWHKAVEFWRFSDVAHPRAEEQRVLWEIDLVNGVDIAQYSQAPDEKEVATFPGAVFEVTSVEVTHKPMNDLHKGKAASTWHLHVKAKQRK